MNHDTHSNTAIIAVYKANIVSQIHHQVRAFTNYGERLTHDYFFIFMFIPFIIFFSQILYRFNEMKVHKFLFCLQSS